MLVDVGVDCGCEALLDRFGLLWLWSVRSCDGKYVAGLSWSRKTAIKRVERQAEKVFCDHATHFLPLGFEEYQ